MQLLRLPPADFEARCLETEGVPVENARAFRSKFWQKHIDAQKMKAGLSQPSDELASADELYARFQESSSQDPNPNSAAVPFRERIRPGMVVKWTGPVTLNRRMPEGIQLAVIMGAVSGPSAIPASVMHEPDAFSSTDRRQYLCAIVVPGLMTDTFTVELWRQVVLDVEWMEQEMLLVYDSATRYYHLAI
jgi:kinesin family member 2/24